MSYAELANDLESRLGLEWPPIALARADAPPAGIAIWSSDVPSACTLWRRAEHVAVFAAAGVHMGCPIGAMVMGFELDAAKHDELMGLVGDMCAIAYIAEDEVERIPHFAGPTAGVVYGPLADLPLEPDVVIVWASAKQAMLLEEALGAAAWTAPSGSVFGRPACAALPVVGSRRQAVLSLGCIGMRTFTEIPDAYSMVVIPAAVLPELRAGLDRTLRANAAMESVYQTMKAAGGKA